MRHAQVLLAFSLVVTGARADPPTSLGELEFRGLRVTVDALLAALANRNIEMRRLAVWGLRDFGPDARAAVPALINLLHDPDDQIRAGAAGALGNGGPVAKELPALIEALKDPAPPVQYGAVKSLARIGPAAKAAVPALLARMDNTVND